LPLFRKLKDGEFCSAAHREQFIAQADQLALATLAEQRQRTVRAAQPAPRQTSAPGFTDKYLAPTLTAMPLRQLANMAQEPAAVAVMPFMPERDAALSSRTIEAELWPFREAGPNLPAEQTLQALSDFGAAAAPGTAAPGTAAPGTAALGTASPELPTPPPMAGRVSGLRVPPAIEPAVDLAKPRSPGLLGVVAARLMGPRLSFAVDAARQIQVPIPAESPEPPKVGKMLGLAAIDPRPNDVLLGRAANPYLSVSGPLAMADCRQAQPDFGLRRATALKGFEIERQTAPDAACLPGDVAWIRFPALTPKFSSMPPRTRASLRVAAPAEAKYAGAAQAPATPIQILLHSRPCLTPPAYSEVAVGERLQGPAIDGRLTDLLPALVPAQLAPPQRILWRVEAQVPPAFHMLAVRPMAGRVTMLRPQLALAGVGPRRHDRQLRLNAILRPARAPEPTATESMSFHLEPKLLRPRLRATPDPARRGSAAVRSKGQNHADAAVASIKIPVLRRFWQHAPADIRWVALIIPLVLFLAWYSVTPGGKALNQQGKSADLAVDTSGFETTLASFKARISSRAAVELSEDFRAGLAEWQGGGDDWAANWSYDQAGFVRPGNLAIFGPTRTLYDYNFEFLGQIENRGMSWVYRAKDTRNYYLGKLVITQGGPVPEVALVRSVVKNGRETQRKVILVTTTSRADTLYRVRVDVNGSDFTTSVLGQVVDTFSDSTHTQGGVGFQGGRGETSRIRWLEVSHQYDTIGRLCAMLVPYGFSGASMPMAAMPAK